MQDERNEGGEAAQFHITEVRVKLTDEWPRRSLTTFTLTPAISKCDAWVWRRSWRRMTGTSAESTSLRNAWPTDFGRNGSPISFVKTRSLALADTPSIKNCSR